MEKSYFFSWGLLLFWPTTSLLAIMMRLFQWQRPSDRVRLYHTEAKGWISSPAGELFRWWDVDLQLWDLAKANIHLDLSGSIQLCSTLTSCSLPLFSTFFSWGRELIKLFFAFSPSDPPPYPLRCSQELYCKSANRSLEFFTVNLAGLQLDGWSA